jgi:uncharacterized protein
MASDLTWVPSRFNMRVRTPEGALLVFNSFSGAFFSFEGEEADYVVKMLDGPPVAEPKGLLSVLACEGLLVPSTSDELARARHLHQLSFERTDKLSLTLMPNENCNFRCTYCYEEFKRNKMPREVIDGVVNLARREAPGLRMLNVSWFGGEALTALDIIEEISQRLIEVCDEHGIRYASGMTTNGYLLTPERAARSLAARVARFQITLDGPAESHNRLRVLASGGGTFDAILANLRELRDRQQNFHVRLRVNFTADTAPLIPSFVEFLGGEFGNDPRFSIHFKPVGHWGGPQDHAIKTCDQRSGENHEIEFMGLALKAGFPLDAWRESMRPFGSVCYAADPRSFVIGSDGTVYKCTVAFNDPRNHVGRLTPDGRLNISEDLHRPWITSGEETDTGCQQCGFRPACQGNLCPLERLNRNEKRCPTVKTRLDQYLPLLAIEAMQSRRN